MEKPFFVSHTAGLVFDEPKDWYQYVQQHGYTAKEVVLESNGFKWNIHNCCLNPKRTEIKRSIKGDARKQRPCPEISLNHSNRIQQKAHRTINIILILLTCNPCNICKKLLIFAMF